jgi:hypothetical protein
MIHVRALQPENAPTEQRRCVADAAAGGVSLSFGLFDGDRLVGHLVCCGFKPTIFPGEIGEALHVRHIAVLPQYRPMLPRLVRRFGIEARRHFPGSSIEASAVESALRIGRAHPAFFAREGYAITRHADSGEMLNGEIRYLVRWQPIPDWEPHVPTVEQLVARSRCHPVEVDGVRYDTALVREEREWEALGRVWDRLLLMAPDHPVSQIYEYQRSWWRHAGRSSELFIVLLVRDGEVLGIAPLQIEVVKAYGRWSRQLSFIGSHSDVERPRFLFPADDARLARALVAALTVRSDKWDLCDFRGDLGRADGSQVLESAFRSRGFLVSASGSGPATRLRVSRRTPFFLAVHALGFRLQLGSGSWRRQVSQAMLPAVPQLTLRSWRPDDQA